MVATFSSQLRIRNFRKKHNNSYFRKYRQNIATINQLLVAVYLTLLTALFKEGIVMTILLNYPPTVSYDTFLKINNLLNCIIIPSYWTKSTKNEFEDFWSIQTCFWKTKPKALSKSMDVEIVPLEPRRPSFSITLITYGSLTMHCVMFWWLGILLNQKKYRVSCRHVGWKRSFILRPSTHIFKNC